MAKSQDYYNKLPDCSIVDYELIPLPEACLLWCGVSFEDLADEVKLLTNISQSIYKHPYIPCLEKKTRVINRAINEGKLRVVREHGEGGEIITDYLGNIKRDNKGNPLIDHVAYDRRHFWIKDLKAFISENFPNDRPKTIFYDEELKPSVNVEDNLKLQAKINELQITLASEQSKIRDYELAMQSLSHQTQLAKTAQQDAEERLERGRELYRQLQTAYNQLKLPPESNINLDNTLYLLGEVINAVKSKHKQWTQSAIIDEIFTLRQGKSITGLEQRTIEEYFSNANKRLKAK
ncbi:hypothetical protein [Actinobacillus suis]|uniref:Uncharacterized protein n=3 Tax=Actinobacillus suis TaxID=716 RepID=K0G391_ACTSU|nr:hypothetical protein [Actinobacillus suis]AFU18706.1 hypothetical protein ASU2_02820 [Actinobacillus suis H91-0380]AIJ30786.1 hypothetical protein ASU1_02550 [Actinobacillus suis ATCC 33415]MCO4169180.1 hypothetical protein [Actinobacillus suis]MCQ9629784.1 hypothetical protein [Actinobacillus suis]MCQ9632272.1 hypothetical protein [Actinobacillus suis]